MKKYLVSYQRLQQTSPEGHFVMRLESKIFTEDNTIKDIENWMSSKMPNSSNPFNSEMIEISNPEGLQEAVEK